MSKLVIATGIECLTVLIGHWTTALDVLDRARDIDAVLAETEDLFAKYDKMNAPVRKRASRRAP